jgi:hypothetical protein
VHVALVVIVLLASTPAAAAEPPDRYERPRVGLSVVVPAGWKVVRKPISYCTNPVQRIALRGKAATVQIVESLGYGAEGFPPRPRRFELLGAARWVPCCPPADGKGWFFPFRDGGRAFYAYVYLGASETRADALRILDSFRVRPRA